MIVPRRITHSEIQVDVFLDPPTAKKKDEGSVRKIVQEFVIARIEHDWSGLKLGGIGRPTEAQPPNKTFRRSTIEEIMGASLDD